MGVAAECWAAGYAKRRTLDAEQATAAGITMVQGSPEAEPSHVQEAPASSAPANVRCLPVLHVLFCAVLCRTLQKVRCILAV